MNRNLIIFLALVVAIGLLVTYFAASVFIPLAEDDDSEGDQNSDSTYISIVTHEATMISTGFAMFNAELVNMKNFSSVEVYFVWGENPGDYTKETPKQTMTSPGEFSAEISDLFMPDETYYFQARSVPQGQGKELSFYVN